MSQWMDVCFLGTSSGGGPSESRNCSSLALDITGDGSLWLVDCAEGTVRQFAINATRVNNANERSWKLNKVTKIFVTHMHADHIMGIPTMLRNVLGFPHPQGTNNEATKPTVQIYGPAGLRTLIRTILSLTHTRSADKYCVHELLTPSDTVTACTKDVLHSNELPGRDVVCGVDGFWRDLECERTYRTEITVHAGPIAHRDPCIGYIFHEPVTAPPLPPPRKLVILGDCSSATALTPLIASTPGRVSLLVHEATDAYIPANVDDQMARKRTPAVVAAKTEERGHSTPEQAGAVAGMWGAEQLVLNHIGARFPAPSNADPRGKRWRTAIMQEIERQATEAWYSTPCILDTFLPASASSLNGSVLIQPARVASASNDTTIGPPRGARAVAAYDFMTVHVPVAQSSQASTMSAAVLDDYAAFAGSHTGTHAFSTPRRENNSSPGKRQWGWGGDTDDRAHHRRAYEGRYGGDGGGSGPSRSAGAQRENGGGSARHDRRGHGNGYRGKRGGGRGLG